RQPLRGLQHFPTAERLWRPGTSLRLAAHRPSRRQQVRNAVMSPQLISILVAVMVLGAMVMVVVGVQSSRARASTPEMENRLERYGHITDVTPTATASKQRPGSAMSGMINTAVKDKSFAANVLTQLARA